MQYLLLRLSVLRDLFLQIGSRKNFLRDIFLRILAKFPKINPTRFNLALINPLKLVFCFLLLVFKVLDAVLISFNSMRDECFTVPTCTAQNLRFSPKDYSLKSKCRISLNILEYPSPQMSRALQVFLKM